MFYTFVNNERYNVLNEEIPVIKDTTTKPGTVYYYISNDDTMSTGDKIALNSSLKSIDSYVVEKNLEPYTESGQKLDGLFSLISINARMVNSIWYNGWIGKILYTISKRWAKNFLQEIGEPIPTNERDVKIE